MGVFFYDGHRLQTRDGSVVHIVERDEAVIRLTVGEEDGYAAVWLTPKQARTLAMTLLQDVDLIEQADDGEPDA